MTHVVHVRSVNLGDPDVVYIGRRNTSLGLRTSLWANPFRIRPARTREQAIEQYRTLMMQRLAGESFPGAKYWRVQLQALEGKRLACWCWPARCHGDVLVDLLGSVS